MFVVIQEATSQIDREAVYRFRYRIVAEEFGKQYVGLDHERRESKTEYDAKARLLVALDRDSGAIVGSLRLWLGSDHPFPPELVDALQLKPMLDALGTHRVSHSGSLMVDPALRGKTVASLLMAGMFKLSRQAGVLVDTCIAEMSLVHLYHQLGYRPYSKPFRASDDSALRIPLALTVLDTRYLERVGSPFRQLARESDDDHGKTAQALGGSYREFYDPRVTPQQIRALWASIAQAESSQTVGMLDGIPPEKWAALLTQQPRVTIARGQRLYKIGEEGPGMGLLIRGRLGVTLDDRPEPHFIAVLAPGEPFGELAGLLKRHRTATLVAVEDAEIAILPDDILERFDRESPEMGKQVRNNLVRLFGKRLIDMNRLVAGLQVRVEETIRPQPAAERVGPNTAFSLAPPRQQAKKGETGVDPLAHSEQQAAALAETETYWFQRLGVQDGWTLAEFASGYGFSSLVLARAFPTSQVIGVEASKAKREAAEARIRELGLTERCSVTEGTPTAVPLADGSVDFVYIRLALQTLADPAAALHEAGRILRPGGMVLVLETDDSGFVLQPEPEGLAAFVRRARRAQTSLGGDTALGRKLLPSLVTAGFEAARVDIATVASQDVPLPVLLDLAVGTKADALRQAKMWHEADWKVTDEIARLAAMRGAWGCVSLFFAHGRSRGMTKVMETIRTKAGP